MDKLVMRLLVAETVLAAMAMLAITVMACASTMTSSRELDQYDAEQVGCVRDARTADEVTGCRNGVRAKWAARWQGAPR